MLLFPKRPFLQNEIFNLSSNKADIVAENIRLKEELIDLRLLYLENQDLKEDIESYQALIENISDFELKYYESGLILKNSTDEYCEQNDKSMHQYFDFWTCYSWRTIS